MIGRRNNGHGAAGQGDAGGREPEDAWPGSDEADEADDEADEADDEGEDPPFPEEPETDEGVDERIAAVVEDLEGIDRRREGPVTELLLGGRVFGRTGEGWIEVALDPAVARVAIRTPDVSASDRGREWIRFAPRKPDRFALDRVEAWLRSAHRRAADA
jgi:hypothetical protein